MEKIKFIRIVAQPQINASTKLEMDLNDIRGDLSDNFNTLMITNTNASYAINIYLDGIKIAYVTANSGVFSFDWQFGMQFNFLSIENVSGAGNITAEDIKVFVGRTG